jgi:hypothetical protein
MRRIESKRTVQMFVIEILHINSLPGTEKCCNFKYVYCNINFFLGGGGGSQNWLHLVSHTPTNALIISYII